MKYALIVVFFGIANGRSIITGSEVASIPMETMALCEKAKAVIDDASRTGYISMIAACVQVKE